MSLIKLVEEYKTVYPVKVILDCFGVKRSTFYRWKAEGEKPIPEDEVVEKIEQLCAENQFVLHYDIFPNPTDIKTFLPLLDSYPHDLKMVVADAGYGSEENLTLLDQLGVDYLIKYGMFDKEQTRKQKQSPKNLNNWLYDDINDTYTHPDGWEYHFDYVKHNRTATGFEQEIKVYNVNHRYQELKRQESQALLSEEGSRIFSQRKVDVEPVFGQIKA